MARLHQPHACHIRRLPRATSFVRQDCFRARKSTEERQSLSAMLFILSLPSAGMMTGCPSFEALREMDARNSNRPSADSVSPATRQNRAASNAEAPFVLPQSSRFPSEDLSCLNSSGDVVGMSHFCTSCWRDLRSSSLHARCWTQREYPRGFQPVMVSSCQSAPYTKPYELLCCIR